MAKEFLVAPANACFKPKRILSFCEMTFAALVLLVLSILAMPRVASAEEGVTRIHVLPFAGGQPGPFVRRRRRNYH